MPRKPRMQSEAQIYHVFSRGSGRQIIFEDDADRESFLRILERCMESHASSVFAYCLMGNHYHLLMRIDFQKLPSFMRKLNQEYARYYNQRYGACGHLFESRYGSQPIDGDDYLLQAVRYIHRNPVEAALCPTCDYPWSSYSDYLESSGLTSTGMILDMLGGRTAFESFHAHSGKGDFIDDAELPLAADGETVAAAAREALKGVDPRFVKSFEKPKRDRCLSSLRSNGLTVKQISLITGISQPTVSRATANK